MAESDEDEAVQSFVAELDIADKMAALSIVRFPNQTLLTKESLDEIFGAVKERSRHMWPATATQVAEWWRERERVTFDLTGTTTSPTLRVNIAGQDTLRQGVAIWVNLPQPDSSLRIVAPSGTLPQILKIDNHRAALVLKGLAAGQHQWQLQFDPPVATSPR